MRVVLFLVLLTKTNQYVLHETPNSTHNRDILILIKGQIVSLFTSQFKMRPGGVRVYILCTGHNQSHYLDEFPWDKTLPGHLDHDSANPHQ